MVSNDAHHRRTVEDRLAALSAAHRDGIVRFRGRLYAFLDRGLLNRAQVEVVEEHLLRLGERRRNPANTGNLEDLFCHTLEDTRDPIRAYAQSLADSVKVVPMDDQAKLEPPLRSLQTGRVYRRVGDLDEFNAGDKMLITHTMVAYGDDEMLASAAALVKATIDNASLEAIDREVAKMAVQSQHGPSSTFILARTHGLTLELTDLYRRAGYDEQQTADAQRFYDICGAFEPDWVESFLIGKIPETGAWLHWRECFLDARSKLPDELLYQLSSDTLTNFLSGTMQSGKWTDALVYFGDVEDASGVPAGLASIVNQYIAEHLALHDRPAEELVGAVADSLQPWGVVFRDQRAIALEDRPEKFDEIQTQFDAARARKRSAK